MSNLLSFANERNRLLSIVTTLQGLEGGTIISLDGRQQHSADVLQIVSERLQERRFKVLVAGEFNAGKSFFINTLLNTWTTRLSDTGKRIWDGLLSVDILPATTVLTEIHYAARRSERIRLRSGEEVPLESVDLANITSLKTFAIPQYISKHLPTIALKAVDKISDRDRQIAKQLFERVDRVIVTFPSDLLSEGVSLIDSPGLGAIYEEHKQVTIAEMERSDCIIFLVDSGATLSQMAESFLLDARSFVSSFLFVQTKTDQHDLQQSKQVEQYNLARLESLTGSECKGSYFAVSAKQYRDSPEPEKREPFTLLVGAIKRHLAENSGRRFLDQESSIVQLVLASLIDSAQRTIDAEFLTARELMEDTSSLRVLFEDLNGRYENIANALRSKTATLIDDLSSLRESITFELNQAVQRVADQQSFIERLFVSTEPIVSQLRIVANETTYRHGRRLTREFRQLSGNINDALAPSVARWMTAVLPTYSIPKLPTLNVSFLDRLDRNHVAVLQGELESFADNIISSLRKSITSAADSYLELLRIAFENERLSLGRRLEAAKAQQERAQLDSAAEAIRARSMKAQLESLRDKVIQGAQ